jgi:hypothetical protein
MRLPRVYALQLTVRLSFLRPGWSWYDAPRAEPKHASSVHIRPIGFVRMRGG